MGLRFRVYGAQGRFKVRGSGQAPGRFRCHPESPWCMNVGLGWAQGSVQVSVGRFRVGLGVQSCGFRAACGCVGGFSGRFRIGLRLV